MLVSKTIGETLVKKGKEVFVAAFFGWSLTRWPWSACVPFSYLGKSELLLMLKFFPN